MKEQYVGDVNDYRKYALLRHFAIEGRIRVGVCWMLTPADGRTDGSLTKYLDQDPLCDDHELFSHLKEIGKAEGARRLSLIERRKLIPGALYFNEFLSDRIALRRAFFETAIEHLGRAELIFFDPDNGSGATLNPERRAELLQIPLSDREFTRPTTAAIRCWSTNTSRGRHDPGTSIASPGTCRPLRPAPSRGAFGRRTRHFSSWCTRGTLKRSAPRPIQRAIGGAAALSAEERYLSKSPVKGGRPGPMAAECGSTVSGLHSAVQRIPSLDVTA